MSSIPPTIFETLTNQLTALPLWVKHVVYSMLKVELESKMSRRTLDMMDNENMLQTWIPEVTALGVQELEAKTGKASQGLLKIIHQSRYRKNVINITIINNWSLEQCALYLIEGIDGDFLVRPKSGVVFATIEYLAGKTRLGEYLVRIGRVTAAQLDQALRTQQYIEEAMGERTGIANVMINLDYIQKQDSEGILFLKEESRKPFSGEAVSTSPQAGARSSSPQQASPQQPQQSQQQAPQGFPAQQSPVNPQAGWGNNPQQSG